MDIVPTESSALTDAERSPLRYVTRCAMNNCFTTHYLDDVNRFYVGELPTELRFTDESFSQLWDSHPPDFNEIHLHGRRVKIPRWQQAFGADYHFSGQTSEALPVPPLLSPFLEWSQHNVDSRLNGLLLNWYDGSLGHYIGKHRDSTTKMVEGAPIVTISFGETRTFRLRPHQGKGFTDFEATDGSVFVLPYETNLAFTHEVPKSKRATGRRVSVTLRAFNS